MSWSPDDYRRAGWHRVTVRVPKQVKDAIAKATAQQGKANPMPIWRILWHYYFPDEMPPYQK